MTRPGLVSGRVILHLAKQPGGNNALSLLQI